MDNIIEKALHDCGHLTFDYQTHASSEAATVTKEGKMLHNRVLQNFSHIIKNTPMTKKFKTIKNNQLKDLLYIEVLNNLK